MAEFEQPESKRFSLHQIPNSLLVLLTIALLLRGPAGVFQAFWTYTTSLFESLLGGEDLFVEVICQTAPLTLSVMAIVFSLRSRWLTFRSATSVVVCGIILIITTWLGGQLRSVVASHHSLASDHRQPLDRSSSDPASSLQDDTPALLASFQQGSATSITDLDLATDRPTENSGGDIITTEEALARVFDFRATPTDGGQHDWRGTVPRVALIPESSSPIGIISRAVNQLFGYVVLYRPRLFLASVLLGSFLGWSWQPRLEWLASHFSRHEKRVGQRSDEYPDPSHN